MNNNNNLNTIYNKLSDRMQQFSSTEEKMEYLSNALHDSFEHYFWVGFYFPHEKEMLIGPSAGPLTRLDIKEMLPFENTLVTFDVTGEELLNMIKFNIEVSRKTGNEELQMSGLSYKYRISGDRSELLGAWVNGKEIDPEATYKCGSIDFVLFSQSEFYFGFTPKNGVDSRKLLSEATIEFLSENKVIDAKLTGAIIRLEE